MSVSRNIFRTCVTLTLAAALTFNSSMALAADQSASAVQDVQLRDGGTLTTRVVDLQGNPVHGEQVVIEFKGKQIASAVSDENGFVAISGLRPGLHSIVTPMGATACRLWTEGAAPPSAIDVPAVVSDAEVIRGQFGAFNLPMVVYATVSIAALIVAIEAHNDSEDLEDANAALARRVEALENASP